MAYPSTSNNLTATHADGPEIIHASDINANAVDTNQLTVKVGTSAGTPSIGMVLTGTGPGTSAWQAGGAGVSNFVIEHNSDGTHINAGLLAPAAGGVDDTTVLQAFLTANGGRTILMRAGTYMINTTLTVPSNTRLVGVEQGRSIIKSKAQAGLQSITLFNLTNPGIELNGLTIDCNAAANTTQSGVYIITINTNGSVKIKSCTFNISTSAGIYTPTTGTPTSHWTDYTVEECTFNTPGGPATWFEGDIDQIRILRNRIMTPPPGSYGFEVRGSSSGGGPAVADFARFVWIEGNVVDLTATVGAGSLAIEVFGNVAYAKITKNLILGPSASPTSGAFFGISTDANIESLVDGNTIYLPATASANCYAGIEVASYAHGNVVSHNTVVGPLNFGCVTSSTHTNNPGSTVWFGNTIDNTAGGIAPGTNDIVDGNRFIDCSWAGVITQSASVGNIKVTNNKFLVRARTTELLGILFQCPSAPTTYQPVYNHVQGNHFGPDLDGPATNTTGCIRALKMQNSGELKFFDNTCDGSAPGSNTAVSWGALEFGDYHGGYWVSRNHFKNYYNGAVIASGAVILTPPPSFYESNRIEATVGGGTVTNWYQGIQTQDWIRGMLTGVYPATAFAAGASPYTYSNADHYPEQVTVSGGTVSQIALRRNATNTNTGLTSGVFSLGPQDALVITHTSAPNLTKLPVIT